MKQMMLFEEHIGHILEKKWKDDYSRLQGEKIEAGGRIYDIQVDWSGWRGVLTLSYAPIYYFRISPRLIYVYFTTKIFTVFDLICVPSLQAVSQSHCESLHVTTEDI